MSDVNDLELLANLHASGALSDQEFKAAKVRLIGQPSETSVEEVVPMDFTALDPKWQRRFQFFAQHGNPYSSQATPAVRGLSMSDRILILMNGWAFLFGIFYFFILGIPKRGIGIAIIGVVCFLLLQRWGIFTASPRYFGIVMQVIFASTANYYYFIKVTHGRDSWDPLKDLRPVPGAKSSGSGGA